LEFFKNELATFRKSLGSFGGKEITDEALAQAIFLYNGNRAKVREMYEFRKSNPPLITGTEVTKVLVAAMGLPIQESIELVSSVIDEVKQRTSTPAKKLPRIMVVGGEIDGDTFIKMIEDSGASVVFDELCPGTREHWPDIKQTKNPMDDIAERHLKINCPRTCREKTGATYQDDLEGRFDQNSSIPGNN
jgi:benzoyl-CoA reductase/2-hydroxyglutaryl-CoA dehydratase subunit BcrC/BadD/HgdB